MNLSGWHFMTWQYSDMKNRNNKCNNNLVDLDRLDSELNEKQSSRCWNCGGLIRDPRTDMCDSKQLNASFLTIQTLYWVLLNSALLSSPKTTISNYSRPFVWNYLSHRCQLDILMISIGQCRIRSVNFKQDVE